MCGNKNLIKLLEHAKSAQLSESLNSSQEITGSGKIYDLLFLFPKFETN